MSTAPRPLVRLHPVLRTTFEALGSAAPDYVVLRGFDPLDELERSIDIDVFIPASAIARVTAALRLVGWRKREHQIERFPHLFFDSWTGEHGFVRSLDVVTDLCYGPGLHSLRDAGRVGRHGRTIDGVRIPEPWMAAFMFALHVALDKGSLSEPNALRARAMLGTCRAAPEGRAILEREFGVEAGTFVESFFRSIDQPSEVAALGDEARALPQLRGRPIWARMHRVVKRLIQLRRPVARIAVIGIDGSGKSTLVNAITSAPSTIRIGSGYLGSNHYRSTPSRWLQGALTRHRGRGDTGSFAYRVLANADALWSPFELLFRMLIAEHRREVVLYDRFPLGQDDTTPTTTWGRFIAAYTRWSRWFMPAPDLVVLLDGDEQTLWSRKKESPFEAHAASQRAYRQLLERLPYETVRIRTDGPLESAYRDFRTALTDSRAVQSKIYGFAAPI